MGATGATPRVSMTDVARRAGVSQKTVSRVVNGEPHVADAIRAKVQAAIEEMGFRPNAAARALVTRRNQRIGMVTMSTSLYGPASILEGVDSALRGSGYYLSVARTQGNGVADLQAAIDELVTQDIAGLVLSEPIDLGHPGLRIPSGLPVLSFGSPTPRTTTPGTTTPNPPEPVARPGEFVMGADETAGARSAAEHLLALGHRTVHHIGGTEGWSATARRIAGWRAALSDAGIEAPPVVHGAWTPRSGHEAAVRPAAPLRASPRSSPPTTTWPSARSGPSSRRACGSPRTSASWGSTTPPRPSSSPPPSRRCARTSPRSPAWPCTAWCAPSRADRPRNATG